MRVAEAGKLDALLLEKLRVTCEAQISQETYT
jgi:hypothetical protein